MKSRVLALAPAALLAGLAVWWSAGGDKPPATVRAVIPETATAPRYVEPAMDGQLALDGYQQLIVNAGLKARFDALLALKTPPDLAWLTEQLEHELTAAHLPAGARQRALALFASYLAYTKELAALPASGSSAKPDLTQLRDRFNAREALRQRFFNASDRDGLFGDEVRDDQQALARLEIIGDQSLSLAERQQRLAKMEAALPPEVRAERAASLAHITMAEKSAALRAQGGSEDDVYRQRASDYGTAAADRLAALDRQTDDWQRRLSAYSGEVSRINGDGSLSADDRQAAIKALQDKQFNAQEQRRLAGALELMRIKAAAK
ncbi:lipase secretion chaperone [Andreprevotia chitinilytica]|uniref:lipase secretion chaperone n=1 Tax=Andreprevotia chitinilytica TaxID=396808 RepID=UPI00054FBC8C|nr:lipase secretion chaperone [Andreprevotia chitinilytica]